MPLCLWKHFSSFVARRRVGFVTFSTVNKTPGWDTLFISREEGEEGTANVVWSRQFQDAPRPEETGTKEFYFFSPVYYVCVCVVHVWACMHTFVNEIPPSLSVLQEHLMYLPLCCVSVSVYRVCVWHLQGWQDCKAASSSFSRESIFRKWEQTRFILAQVKMVRMVVWRSHRCTVAIQAVWSIIIFHISPCMQLKDNSC